MPEITRVCERRVISAHNTPDKLTEGLVVSKGSIILFSEDMINVLHAPGIQQLGGSLRLLKKKNIHKTKNEII